jgi:hypothetical protein
MRGPPAVTLAAADRGAWRAVGAGLHGLAAAVLLAWAMQAAGAMPAGPTGIAAIVTFVVAAALAWRLDRPATPSLSWDGAAWQVDAAAARVRPALDLGRGLLLRCTTPPARGWPGSPLGGWCAVSPAAAGAAWVPLRRALFAPASEGGTSRRPA